MAQSLVHNEQAHRFELIDDGVLAGFTEYRLDGDGVATFDHTEVYPAFSGQGLGGRIIGFALEQVRERGTWKIRPVCPFVAAYLRRHPEFGDLIIV